MGVPTRKQRRARLRRRVKHIYLPDGSRVSTEALDRHFDTWLAGDELKALIAEVEPAGSFNRKTRGNGG